MDLAKLIRSLAQEESATRTPDWWREVEEVFRAEARNDPSVAAAYETFATSHAQVQRRVMAQSPQEYGTKSESEMLENQFFLNHGPDILGEEIYNILRADRETQAPALDRLESRAAQVLSIYDRFLEQPLGYVAAGGKKLQEDLQSTLTQIDRIELSENETPIADLRSAVQQTYETAKQRFMEAETYVQERWLDTGRRFWRTLKGDNPYVTSSQQFAKEHELEHRYNQSQKAERSRIDQALQVASAIWLDFHEMRAKQAHERYEELSALVAQIESDMHVEGHRLGTAEKRYSGEDDKLRSMNSAAKIITFIRDHASGYLP